jgi:A/G-specific adenine glycosylase
VIYYGEPGDCLLNKEKVADIKYFQRTLLQWWEQPGNNRDYPWRSQNNRNSYRIAIAELMLRRTRADQVVQVYNNFLGAYPTLTDALKASPEELRRILYPLGLAWRIENILNLLQVAREKKFIEFPLDINDLKELPGIGDYVSNAVACFTQNDPAATLIDTNVVRVLGRIFGLPVHAEARRQRPMRELAIRAVDRKRPADYHYAILDFAALICLPRSPRCKDCPFSYKERCCYFKENSI